MTSRTLTLPILAAAIVAAALVLASARTSTAAPIDLPLDEYLCYQAKESKIPAQTKFKDLEIQRDFNDQFDIARTNNVTKFVNFCNPVSTPSASGGNSAIHLTEYAIKDAKLQAKFVAPLSVYNLSDRLGDRQVTISKPKSLLVRTSKIDFGPIVKCKVTADCAGPAPGDICVDGKRCLPPSYATPPAQPGTPVNTADYMCYSVKGPKGPFPSTTYVDQFAHTESWLANKITKVCAPTNIGPSGSAPADAGFVGHLICYQAKSNKTNSVKFVAHQISTNNALAPFHLEASKVKENCIPALKAINPAVPTVTTPTTLTATSSSIGGVCGTITTNLGGAEGIPNRLNPATGETGNADCTAAGMSTSGPTPCCEGAGAGHCDERNTVSCGGVAIGGGGPSTTLPGPEIAQAPGSIRRFSLGCSGPFDTACTVSGNAGDLPNGVNCTTAGCGFLPPLDTTAPFKLCATIKLTGSASGSLNLVAGTNSLTLPAAVQIYAATATSFPDTGCPRCRTGTATTDPEVFESGGLPGIGVCDDDSATDDDGSSIDDGEIGDTCYVFSGTGLSSDCEPVPGLPLPPIALSVSPSTGGAAISDPVGHFCPGQAGNPDCTAAGMPNPCCTGAGMGSCTNWNGCFGSANASGPRYADTPGTCTGIAVTGIQSGLLITGQPPVNAVIGGLSCLPAVSAGGLSPLINGSLGLPSPLAFTVSNGVEVD